MAKQKKAKQQPISNALLLARIEALEQEVASIKSATHEHTISAETILHLADIIKNDLVSSLSLMLEQQSVEEVAS
jgi:hypothetical protein